MAGTEYFPYGTIIDGTCGVLQYPQGTEVPRLSPVEVVNTLRGAGNVSQTILGINFGYLNGEDYYQLMIELSGKSPPVVVMSFQRLCLEEDVSVLDGADRLFHRNINPFLQNNPSYSVPLYWIGHIIPAVPEEGRIGIYNDLADIGLEDRVKLSRKLSDYDLLKQVGFMTSRSVPEYFRIQYLDDVGNSSVAVTLFDAADKKWDAISRTPQNTLISSIT